MSTEDGTITETKPKKGAIARGFKRVREPQKPGTFAVVLHNDNYTPRDFVVYVLQVVFNHPSAPVSYTHLTLPTNREV